MDLKITTWIQNLLPLDLVRTEIYWSYILHKRPTKNLLVSRYCLSRHSCWLNVNRSAAIGVVRRNNPRRTDAVVVEKTSEREFQESVLSLRVAGIQPAAFLGRIAFCVIVAGIPVTIVPLWLDGIEVRSVSLVPDDGHMRRVGLPGSK